MDKVFYYPNAVVHIVIPENHSTIHKATEEFMKRVIRIKMEEFQNGNNNTSGDI